MLFKEVKNRAIVMADFGENNSPRQQTLVKFACEDCF